MKRLLEIQQELKVAKDQFNSFGNYKYRSCEQILEAVKPLCKKTGTVLTITDDIFQLGDRFYVKATATLYDADTNKEIHHCSASAREQENKKGMDESQVTGAASSYARKYALNGLFCIDDQKDSDNNINDNKNEEEPEKINKKPICPKCGKETSQGAINNWGMCAICYKESKNNA